MNIFLLAAFVAVVITLVEHNHRRASLLPHVPWGAAEDRDLERVRHDLRDRPAVDGRRLRLRLPLGYRGRRREAATC